MPRINTDQKNTLEGIREIARNTHPKLPRLCLLSVTRKANDEPCVLLCISYPNEDGGATISPIAELLDEESIELYTPPE